MPSAAETYSYRGRRTTDYTDGHGFRNQVSHFIRVHP